MTAASPPDRPPERLETSRFVLRPLRTDDAVIDHAAVMAAAARLRVWSGSDWPAAGFTVTDNEEDLARHQEEHEAGDAFTYTVLDVTGERCLGCVYVEPPARWGVPAAGPAGDVVVGLWVVEDGADGALERDLFEAIDRWLTATWGIDRPAYRTHEDDVRQRALFGSAGLEERTRVAVPGRRGRFVLYRRSDTGRETPGT